MRRTGGSVLNLSEILSQLPQLVKIYQDIVYTVTPSSWLVGIWGAGCLRGAGATGIMGTEGMSGLIIGDGVTEW